MPERSSGPSPSGTGREDAPIADHARRGFLRSLVTIAAGAAVGTATGVTAASPAASRTIRLGDSAVRLISSWRDPVDITYVSLHENEQTSVEAARQVMGRRGGRMLELQADGRRLVSFTRAGTRYTFDPNRVFTAPGIQRTLRRYGPYSAAAQAEVAELAAVVLEQVTRGRVFPVVALHNNSGRSYSVESDRTGAPLAAEAAAVHINPSMSRADFFIVTERSAYEVLRGRKFNVVLQAESPTDDGSLSVYCQHQDIPYINVEALSGRLAQQIQMLDTVRGLPGAAGVRG
jgi:hypothetical protein